jgi:hypothetical protein
MNSVIWPLRAIRSVKGNSDSNQAKAHGKQSSTRLGLLKKSYVSGRGVDSNFQISRSQGARAFNQARPLPESLAARHGIEPCPPKPLFSSVLLSAFHHAAFHRKSLAIVVGLRITRADIVGLAWVLDLRRALDQNSATGSVSESFGRQAG